MPTTILINTVVGNASTPVINYLADSSLLVIRLQALHNITTPFKIRKNTTTLNRKMNTKTMVSLNLSQPNILYLILYILTSVRDWN